MPQNGMWCYYHRELPQNGMWCYYHRELPQNGMWCYFHRELHTAEIDLQREGKEIDHACTCTHTYTNTYTNIYTHIHTCTHTHTHTCTHIHICTHTYTHIHARVHTYVHTCTHTCTTHTHTHKTCTNRKGISPSPPPTHIPPHSAVSRMPTQSAACPDRPYSEQVSGGTAGWHTVPDAQQ